MKKFLLVLGLVGCVAIAGRHPGRVRRRRRPIRASPAEPITIGATLPLSGPASLYAPIRTG